MQFRFSVFISSQYVPNVRPGTRTQHKSYSSCCRGMGRRCMLFTALHRPERLCIWL